jgi:disulfide bond formation protein DsbB
MIMIMIIIRKIINFVQENAIKLILAQVILAILGSLYFSDIKQYEPCVLCWYQRICMYSMFPMILTALLRKENKIYQYTLPISIFGLIIAIYHNLLYTGFIKTEFCSTGISCTSKYVEYLGFITIPLMSLIGFIVIIALSIISRNYIKNQNLQNKIK